MGRRPSLTTEQVLVGIQAWVADHGRPPSIEELRRELKVGSTRTVFRYLQLLEEKGLIRREPGEHGLKLLKPRATGIETRAVPILGQVPAGPMMLAEQNIEAWIRVPKSIARPSTHQFFFLHVRGDSMNRARVGNNVIEDGDLVLVHRRSTAQPGEIVVALLDGETTVKRFDIGSGYFVLKPESTNRRHKPILLDQDFRVLGVVTRVFKKGSELVQQVFEDEKS